MSDLNKVIGENIRLLRSTRGITLDQTAALTGVSKSMIGQIERGTSTPTVTTLWKICNGLKVSFSSLLEQGEKETLVIKKAELHPLSEKKIYNIFNYIPFNVNRKFEVFSMELMGNATHISEAHTDAVEEIVYVTKGEVDVHVNNECHHLTMEDLLRFNAGFKHTYENKLETDVRLFIIIVYQ